LIRSTREAKIGLRKQVRQIALDQLVGVVLVDLGWDFQFIAMNKRLEINPLEIFVGCFGMRAKPHPNIREHQAARVGLQNLERLRLQRQFGFRHPCALLVDLPVWQLLEGQFRLHRDLPVDVLPRLLAVLALALARVVVVNDL
jgi:hypothetical protein